MKYQPSFTRMSMMGGCGGPVVLVLLFLQLLLLAPTNLFCDGFGITVTTPPYKTSSSRATLLAATIERREQQEVATASSANPILDAKRYVSEGMDAFRRGDVMGSIEKFDRADQMFPDHRYTPYLWQRGISLYYANQFDEASQQFRTDIQVNPLDTEEIVWDIASQMMMDPQRSFPLTNAMSLPNGKRDPRPIMNTVYRLFKGSATEWDLYKAGLQSQRQVLTNSSFEEFYALFYLGLYCEAVCKEESKAREYMIQAVRTDYAQHVGASNYMVSVAKVHCKVRGWL